MLVKQFTDIIDFQGIYVATFNCLCGTKNGSSMASKNAKKKYIKNPFGIFLLNSETEVLGTSYTNWLYLLLSHGNHQIRSKSLR